MPDVYVPMDTSMYSDYYRDVVAKGILNRFVLNYVDENRDALESKYTNFADFNREFIVDKPLMSKLISAAEKAGVKMNEEEYLKSEKHLSTQMKALIARDLWSTSEYFEVINPLNKEYLKAIELIGNKSEYSKLLQ